MPLLDKYVVRASNQNHSATAMINNWLIVGLEDGNYGTITTQCLGVLGLIVHASGGGGCTTIASDDDYKKMCAARVMVAVAGISTKSFSQCDFFKKGKHLLEAMVDRCVAGGGPLRRGNNNSSNSPHHSATGSPQGDMEQKRGRERELRLLLLCSCHDYLWAVVCLTLLPTHMKTIRSGGNKGGAGVGGAPRPAIANYGGAPTNITTANYGSAAPTVNYGAPTAAAANYGSTGNQPRLNLSRQTNSNSGSSSSGSGTPSITLLYNITTQFKAPAGITSKSYQMSHMRAMDGKSLLDEDNAVGFLLKKVLKLLFDILCSSAVGPGGGLTKATKKAAGLGTSGGASPALSLSPRHASSTSPHANANMTVSPLGDTLLALLESIGSQSGSDGNSADCMHYYSSELVKLFRCAGKASGALSCRSFPSEDGDNSSELVNERSALAGSLLYLALAARKASTSPSIKLALRDFALSEMGLPNFVTTPTSPGSTNLSNNNSSSSGHYECDISIDGDFFPLGSASSGSGSGSAGSAAANLKYIVQALPAPLSRLCDTFSVPWFLALDPPSKSKGVNSSLTWVVATG